MIRSRIILLVEDNPDDADLTLAAFEESKALNEIVVAPLDRTEFLYQVK